MPLGFWDPACRIAMLALVGGTALVASAQGGSCGPLTLLVVGVGGTGGVVLGLSEHGGALADLVELEDPEGPGAGETLADLAVQVDPEILIELGVLAETHRRGQRQTPPSGGCGR